MTDQEFQRLVQAVRDIERAGLASTKPDVRAAYWAATRIMFDAVADLRTMQLRAAASEDPESEALRRRPDQEPR